MTTEQIKQDMSVETARPGMLDTIIHLGTATTNLAIDQVGNALTALVNPTEAIDHVKDTLMNLSDAMNNSAAIRVAERPASDMRGASDGMEYLAADLQVDRPVDHARSPFVDVRPPAAQPVVKARVVKKMNHRKS